MVNDGRSIRRLAISLVGVAIAWGFVCTFGASLVCLGDSGDELSPLGQSLCNDHGAWAWIWLAASGIPAAVTWYAARRARAAGRRAPMVWAALAAALGPPLVLMGLDRVL